MGDDAGWVPDEVWRRAASVRWDPMPVPRLSVPVIDPDLGAIAVLRLPDGREVYGADGGDFPLEVPVELPPDLPR